ncbi:hypothetical protein [Pseudofrankia asymbiotica]|uniref:Uncharacterized protein n=1 Tax=Pseudofrankia asymbiotica TaxID=1834516 RepID=A0A1V2IIN7_9ACTN|nr:hypothetical protein [Pseudofrankia asymbiotica]ONH32789.1 hypothetical protein BL253_03360 [Pseudofrankia asymbiotica]
MLLATVYVLVTAGLCVVPAMAPGTAAGLSAPGWCLPAYALVGSAYVALMAGLSARTRSRGAGLGERRVGVVESARGWSFVSLGVVRRSARVGFTTPRGQQRSRWLHVIGDRDVGQRVELVFVGKRRSRPQLATTPRDAIRAVLWEGIGAVPVVALVDALLLAVLLLG